MLSSIRQEAQSIGTIGTISAANTPVSGYSLLAPGVADGSTRDLPPVPRLQTPNALHSSTPASRRSRSRCWRDTIDIEGRVVVSTLGLYARTLITEGNMALVNSDTLTGSVGLLQNGALAADLVGLGWTDLATLGWGPITSDIVGNALLVPTQRYNNIRTLSDFQATGNFELLDSPLTPAQTLRAARHLAGRFSGGRLRHAKHAVGERRRHARRNRRDLGRY